MTETTTQQTYLQKARDKFFALHAECGVEELWQHVSKQLRQSYWNGVEHGATGVKQPRGKRADLTKDEANS